MQLAQYEMKIEPTDIPVRSWYLKGFTQKLTLCHRRLTILFDLPKIPADSDRLIVTVYSTKKEGKVEIAFYNTKAQKVYATKLKLSNKKTPEAEIFGVFSWVTKELDRLIELYPRKQFYVTAEIVSKISHGN